MFTIKIYRLSLLPIISLVLSLAGAPLARAVECGKKACIKVYAEGGQIIIEGRKAGVKEKKAPPKKVIRNKVVKPVPAQRVPVKKAAIRKYRHPAPRSVSKPRRAAVQKVRPPTLYRASLNDRLVKLLPMASIARQPSQGALVNVPVIYWCDLPAVFTTKVAIVGEVIDVTMRPSFLWSFGDGSFKITTSAGSGFPQESISHGYSREGTYLVTLLATWGGTWTRNGVARSITGQVKKYSFASLQVANGPSRFLP